MWAKSPYIFIQPLATTSSFRWAGGIEIKIAPCQIRHCSKRTIKCEVLWGPSYDICNWLSLKRWVQRMKFLFYLSLWNTFSRDFKPFSSCACCDNFCNALKSCCFCRFCWSTVLWCHFYNESPSRTLVRMRLCVISRCVANTLGKRNIGHRRENAAENTASGEPVSRKTLIVSDLL